MNTFNTLIDLVQVRAERGPLDCAYRFLADGEEQESSITCSSLETRARAIAAWLQAHCRAGDRVLLLLPPGLQYITAFFGCIFAGAIAVPAYLPRRRSKGGEGRVDAIIRDSSPSIVLTSSSVTFKSQQSDSAINGIPSYEVERISSDLAAEWRMPEVDENSTAFIQYTSGSTSLPKGVVASHSNLLHNQRMIQEVCNHDSSSTFVGWLPLYHDMGLVGNVMQPLFIGASCVLMSPAAFVQKPIRWLRAISKYRAHTSGGPNFAYDLCVRKIPYEEREGLDLSSWAVAFNGAEPVRQETLERFADEFSPYGFRRAALSPCYGLAEASLIVSCKRRLASPLTAHVDARATERHRVVRHAAPDDFTITLVGCGPPVIDTDIAIVDQESRTICPPGRIGEIWISGLGVAQGYWNRPEESEQTFRARLSTSDARTFLRTGDLGFIADGQLFITGRLKDLIIIRGLNHCAEDIEWSVSQCSAEVQTVAAFSVRELGEERLVIAFELSQSSQPAIDEVASLIQQVVSERHELQVHALVPVKMGRIPRTSSGKIQRGLCRKMFLEGELELAPGPRSADAGSLRKGGNNPGSPSHGKQTLPIA
jgi:acyl-CoA synthetase (AMP-forming)/AMP-acid ligase II